MKLYHGGPEKMTLNDIREEGLFGGIFASTCKTVAESHGDIVSVFEIDEDDIADSCDLDQTTFPWFESLNEEEQDMVYALVVDEANIFNVDYDPAWVMDIIGGTDLSEAAWAAQETRGVWAKAAGFKAVRCSDEHGISILIMG